MLEPKHFEVNEAWIVFRLNDTPVRTEADGDFNVLSLMDAASCYIFGTEFVSTTSREPSKQESSRLFACGQAKAERFPEVLFVPEKMVADVLITEAERCDIGVVRVPDDQLLVFIGEARRGFEAYMRGDEPRQSPSP